MRPHSLMDRMRACGVCDVGSIPTEGTKYAKRANCFARGYFVRRSYVLSTDKTNEPGSRKFRAAARNYL